MTRQFRLLRYALPEWRGISTVVLMLLLTIALNVIRPWPMKLLIDQVLGGRSLPTWVSVPLGLLPGPHGRDGLLLWVVVATVLIFIVTTAVSMVQTYAEATVGQRMAYSLGADLFLHVQRLSLLFHSRRPVGDTIARVTEDPSCLPILVNDAMLPLVQAIVTVVTMFVIMWQLQSTMALLCLIVVPFLFFSVRVFAEPMKNRSRSRRDLEGNIMSTVEQTLTAIPAVQAFTRETAEHARFRDQARQAIGAYKLSIWADLWFDLSVGLVAALGTAGLMYLGGRYALEGKISVGTILVFLSYLESLYGPLTSISYLASSVQSAAANADRVLDLLETPQEVQDLPDARTISLGGSVRFEDVVFGYETGRPVLKGVSFEARAGEVIAIVGPTGAGKTTLINLIPRFFDPWSGCVTIDGIDVRNIRVNALRTQVAMVLQDPFIFPFTVAENIAYGRPSATLDEIKAAAVAANADEFIDILSEGYHSVVGERGATLSGGEKQRLSIARALLKDAPILVLDEPTSALDARTEGRLLGALDRLMQGRTTIIIAHRLSTIRNATRILAVDHGEIVEQGSHSELLARGGLYARLYKQQMEIVEHDALPAGSREG
ncbi:MAG: ABC transporter ATP-binding protein [Chloroflexota bacterium]